MQNEESAWTYRSPTDSRENGAHTDLNIYRTNACTNLCQMKFTEGEFVIDKKYAKDLSERRETFRRGAGSKIS